uniref:Lipase domain-containing protein n=1 Tax=Glossina brevipalpis TaxID=37001 RepID=A0A1A9X5J9_9MUSC
MKKFITLIILVLLTFINPSWSLTQIAGIFGTAKQTIDKVANVGTSLLSPEKIFDSSKQLIIGLPSEVLTSAIHTICSKAMSFDMIQSKYLPDVDQMQFQLRTECKRESVPLLRADEMWKLDDFDPSKKFVLLASGWLSTINDTDGPIDVIGKAFHCRGDVNFVAVDVDHYVKTLYTWAALNTQVLGDYIAEGLKYLIDFVPLENIHLIGHSLGAHIMGAAGRRFQQLTNLSIPRITGLDPAKPCFTEGESLSGLMRGDADFVDIIHSNNNVLGKGEPVGDVDFYPGGLVPLVPGCLDIICAHERSWRYFAESIYPGNEYNFEAYRCNSLSGVEDGTCRYQSAFMGYSVANNIKGNFFLNVNGKSPYGMYGSVEREATVESCGFCPYF